VQGLNAAVAGGEQRAVEQRRSNAVVLPVGLDAERGLGLPGKARPSGRNSAAPRSTPSAKKPCTTEPRPNVVST